MFIDVFNGDADGICALVQLRLAMPNESQLITGVKRDISLLTQVMANPDDELVVLDISLAKNRQALMALLAKNVKVLYVDHHFAGEIPQHPYLTSLIDVDANICTSVIVNNYLHQRFTAWAVTGAFGDNLQNTAEQLAKNLSINATELAQLKQLGICLNYNAYGAEIKDLTVHPAELFRLCVNYASPFDFISEQSAIYQQLQDAYTADMAKVAELTPHYQTPNTAVYLLPDAVWSRRVNGVLANHLANRYPPRAHAIVHEYQGVYQISVRAPLSNKLGADRVCQHFSGGGRSAAAGIDGLPLDQLNDFIATFTAFYDDG